jgi:pimeloyl-ACP methyl ester carboxylesterase
VSRSRARLLLLLLPVGAAVVLAGPRYHVEPYAAPPLAVPEAPGAIPGWLAEREAQVPGLRPELAKGVRWAGAAGQRTPLALVYLHGFSASRRELSPVLEDLGAALGANVLFTRLRGHGQSGEALAAARLGEWKADAEEALALGRRLGERVVLVGTSTGGTLATWLAARTPDLHALVLLAPNFGLKDPASRLLIGPWGLQLARRAVGDHRSWKAVSPEQDRFWTTRYPVQALFPVLALVREVDGIDLGRLTLPTLVVYAERDEVLSLPRISARYAALGSPRKALAALPGGHILAGDAVRSPNNARLLGLLRDFLR